MIPALIVGGRRVLHVALSFRDYDFRVGHCGAGRVGNDSANRGGKRLAPGGTSDHQEEKADSRHRCEEFYRTSILRMNLGAGRVWQGRGERLAFPGGNK